MIAKPRLPLDRRRGISLDVIILLGAMLLISSSARSACRDPDVARGWNATTNFSDAWLSHYIPSAEKYPLVYYVNLFYQICISGVLIPMAILVVLDVSSVIRRKWRRRKQQPKPPAAKPADAGAGGKESSHE